MKVQKLNREKTHLKSVLNSGAHISPQTRQKIENRVNAINTELYSDDTNWF